MSFKQNKVIDPETLPFARFDFKHFLKNYPKHFFNDKTFAAFIIIQIDFSVSQTCLVVLD